MEREVFLTKMGGTIGVDGVSFKYIIREINPRGLVAACDDKTDKERLIYLVTLHSPGYGTNNRAVWHNIKNCCISIAAYNCIRDFE